MGAAALGFPPIFFVCKPRRGSPIPENGDGRPGWREEIRLFAFGGRVWGPCAKSSFCRPCKTSAGQKCERKGGDCVLSSLACYVYYGLVSSPADNARTNTARLIAGRAFCAPIEIGVFRGRAKSLFCKRFVLASIKSASSLIMVLQMVEAVRRRVSKSIRKRRA
ncbi:hypothetical protein SAMN02745216_00224 [Desulfatibacillum alkenivorans DSM 16219]|uniref:Uncharacterized protein n=1 Tax=Desulfatibacillum alkenivorans DSM 16219 TaxID=1121393 RepID=A0A1M6CFD7_9BACT|nr:hypothetical protein SAMN02745216_00224 [Desulfatibacillum alkenivorans DSM 16219]